MAWIQARTTKSGKVRYRAYWRDPSGKINGKVFARKRDAEAHGRLMETWKAEGTYFDPNRGRITLTAFVEGEVLIAPDLGAKTRSTYGWVWKTYVRPVLGDRRLNSITRADLKQLLAAMTAHGAGDPTIEKTASFLSSVFGRAVEDERLHRNAAARLRVARAIRRPPRFLSDEEVFAIVQVAGERVAALILFLAYTGLRIGEAVALRVGDLDLLRRRVTVSRAVSEVDGRRIEKSTKTNRVRTVVMPTFVTDALARHLEAFSDPRDPNALVFTSAEGGPVRHRNFAGRDFRPAVERAGITPIPRVHDLRHTAAALAIRRGAGPKQIQEMLGHASITTTLDVYGHLFEVLHEELADRHDAAVAGLASAGRLVSRP